MRLDCPRCKKTQAMTAVCGGAGVNCWYRKSGVAHVHCAVCHATVMLKPEPVDAWRWH